MQITVKSRNADRSAMVHAMASFYAAMLKISKSKFNVEINFRRNMRRDHGMRGVVAVNPDNDRELIIFLDSQLDQENLGLTLAHEMVHVKQHSRGQIKFNKRTGHYTWFGKRFKGDYYDSPWELDAFRNERVLANKLAKVLFGG